MNASITAPSSKSSENRVLKYGFGVLSFLPWYVMFLFCAFALSVRAALGHWPVAYEDVYLPIAERCLPSVLLMCTLSSWFSPLLWLAWLAVMIILKQRRGLFLPTVFVLGTGLMWVL